MSDDEINDVIAAAGVAASESFRRDILLPVARSIERAVIAAQAKPDADPVGWRITNTGKSFLTDRPQDADDARAETDTVVEPLYLHKSADALDAHQCRWWRNANGDQQADATTPVARWYCISREGLATLCRDEADARKTAAGSDVLYRRCAPHRAVRLVESTNPPAEWDA